MSKKKSYKNKRWVGCDVETHYLGDRLKEGRQERKRVTARDRSKYKKTDQDKHHEEFDAKALEEQGLRRGRVISIISQGLHVVCDEREYLCELRGILKKEKTKQKNLVAVGDYVWFEELGSAEGAIAAIEPRVTLLSRADNLSRRKEQLIATNIDQVIITVSVVDPTLKPALIDRYIIATCKGGMQPILVVNKVDLLPGGTEEDREMYEECLQAYAQANIPVIAMSIKTGLGMDQLREVMKGKSSVFSGQSGVGKTSLINIITGLDMRVGETVARTKKGAHTTTSARLVGLPFGGWCVDTPGIKSFGVWDLEPEEIAQYFDEIQEIGQKCGFSNCTHDHETDCAVKIAVENGEISLLRFISYQTLMQTAQDDHSRR